MKDDLIVIKKNIEKYGYHRYVVKQNLTPRFSYTIGLIESLGYELILCGSIYFETFEQLDEIFDETIKILLRDKDKRFFKINDLGDFKIKEVNYSWSSLMMLGALDYFKIDKICALQIIPADIEKYTLDTPDMSKPWCSDDKIWKYLSDDVSWEHNVPKHSVAITNLKALKGFRLTEYFRFESDEWEIFSGNGASEPKHNIRIVPLSVLIGIDPTIEGFINNPVGTGKYRDSLDENNLTWYNWE